MGIKQIIGRMIPRVVFRARDDWRAMKAAEAEAGGAQMVVSAKGPKSEKAQATVVFVLIYQQSWDILSGVYERLLAAGMRVLVLAVPKVMNNEPYDAAVDTADRACEDMCRQQGLNFVGAFNRETGEWFDLEAFAPDYVFYSRPYDEQCPEPYRSNPVSRYAKVCYIPYGYNVAAGLLLESAYRRIFAVNCWRVFVTQDSTLRWTRSYFPYLSRRRPELFQMLGYSGYDGLAKADCALPSEGFAQVIAWFPRWVTESDVNSGSHFLQYREAFLAFAAKHPDVLCICLGPIGLQEKVLLK